jgi:hypothetical protein
MGLKLRVYAALASVAASATTVLSIDTPKPIANDERMNPPEKAR